MELFDQYINDITNLDDNIYKTGILNINSSYNCGIIYIEEKYIIIESKKYLNRAFDGDTVIVEIYKKSDINDDKLLIGYGKIVYIISRKKINKIVGVIHLSKYKYGINSHHIPIYLFTPINKKYPTFYVASRCSEKKDKYAIITYNDWDHYKNYPSGICDNILGDIGDQLVENNVILYYHDIKYKILKNVEIPTIIYDNNSMRKDLRNKLIFTIDPPGCDDADDAVHIEFHNEENEYEVGVHIADVSHFIEPNSSLDIELQNRISTIYPPNINPLYMLPRNMTIELCSLVENQDRYAFTVLYKFDLHGNLKSFDFFKSIINSVKSCTYEETENILNQNDEKNILYISLQLFSKLIPMIMPQITTCNNNIDNPISHFIIETLMVLTNKTIAEILVKHYGENALIRVHNKIQNEIILTDNINNVEDIKLHDHLKIQQMESAKYVQLKQLSSDPFHYGLQLKYYTHFTSPMRRYIDIIVHRMMTNILNNNIQNNDYDIICKNANDINKKIKAAEREFKIISIVDELDKLYKEQKHILTNGFISRITKNTIIIYIPQFDIEVKHKLIPYQLQHILDVTINNQNCTLHNKQTNNDITLKLLDEIIINIIPLPFEEGAKNKLKLEILEPDFHLFYTEKNEI